MEPEEFNPSLKKKPTKSTPKKPSKFLLTSFLLQLTCDAQCCFLFLNQERQRLETILNLCAEYSKPDSDPAAATTVADVQKINKELEKLQLSDEDSVFEDSQMNLETRFRSHLKSSASDSDFSELSSHSRSTAAFLSPRGLRADEHFNESAKPPPFAAPGFLKDATESSYLSITPKVTLCWRKEQDRWTNLLRLCRFCSDTREKGFNYC